MGCRGMSSLRVRAKRCKAQAVPLAEVIIEGMAEDLEDEGRLGDAEDWRDLLSKLARETRLARGPDWGSPLCGPFSRFRPCPRCR